MKQCYPFKNIEIQLCPEMTKNKDKNVTKIRLGMCNLNENECDYINCIHTGILKMKYSDQDYEILERAPDWKKNK